jgi:hypothetical protein
VLLGIVLGRVSERGVDPALGRARVAANRVDLRQKRDVGAEIVCLDRGAHSGAPGAYNQDVVRGFHRYGSYLTEELRCLVTAAAKPYLRHPRPRPGGAGAAEL